jgi:hypothetical protein
MTGDCPILNIALIICSEESNWQELKNRSDMKGKKYFEEFLNNAKTKGEGWVSYMNKIKKADEPPKPKITYI